MNPGHINVLVAVVVAYAIRANGALKDRFDTRLRHKNAPLRGDSVADEGQL